MPRLPRIEYPHAFYHVMNRGRNRENIFHNESDFQLFLDIIHKANIKFKSVVHCYCLMTNHYHLLVETPNANLSQVMHFIGNEYVKKYNKRKGFDGALFKSRYKAILIEEDSYLIALNRYIHRNPIALVKNLKDYKWSSYPSYLENSCTPSWLNKNRSLEILGWRDDLKKYSDFIELNEDEKIYKERKNIPSILGSSDFRKRVLNILQK